MNVWKFIQRLCLIACVLLAFLIVLRLFMPLVERQRKLRAELDAKAQDVQRTAEYLRLLKAKQEKLQEDPRFIEKIAREELGYAKPGETVFRFVDDE
ncbi:MAG: septum formation initiator family protein [Verrucomicrobiota bacterium]|jgi:cell division protein FtsB|nr:septum formation initiator family protein [Verrucomicrobiota bacterium]